MYDGNYYIPRFTSNHFESGMGFEIRYNSTDMAPLMTFRIGECGGNFTTLNGLLTSPSYPNNYPNNAECIYTISTPEGTNINLTKIELDIYEYYDFFSFYADDSCDTDYLEIRDGINEEAPLLGKLCGSESSAPIQSSQNHMWMREVIQEALQKPSIHYH